jgi:hypothetical protein
MLVGLMLLRRYSPAWKEKPIRSGQ